VLLRSLFQSFLDVEVVLDTAFLVTSLVASTVLENTLVSVALARIAGMSPPWLANMDSRIAAISLAAS